MGFKTEVVLLTDAPNQTFTVYLIPEDFNLDEVVIKPREDPAKVLMKK